MDVTALQIEQVARQLNEWATTRRKRRPKTDEDDYALKPLEKMVHSRLGLPNYVKAQQTTPGNLDGYDGSEALSHPSPPYRLDGVPPAIAAPAPPSPPRPQPAWLGQSRTSCDTCRRLKRRCTHKDDEEAPPPKKIGRPRKNQQQHYSPHNVIFEPAARGPALPEAHPSSAASALTLADHQNALPAQPTIIAPGVAIAPAPHRPVFPLPDPNAAIRDALVTWQRQN